MKRRRRIQVPDPNPGSLLWKLSHEDRRHAMLLPLQLVALLKRGKTFDGELVIPAERYKE